MKFNKVLSIIAIFVTSLALAEEPPPAPGHESLDAAKASLAKALAQRPTTLKSESGSVTTHFDLTYSESGDKPLQLDIYQPKDLTEPKPCLVFIHGGAWYMGSRKDFQRHAHDFAAKGYPSVSISYRLAPASTFPSALEDVRSAITWLRKRASEYQIDPDRLALVGASAGAHLAMLAAYQDHETSAAIRAVINLYGPCDLTTAFAKEHPAVEQFLGTTFDNARAVYETASPVHHLDAEDPPTLVLHGTLDEVVPVSQSDDLVKRFEKLGVPYHYDRLPGWPHVMDLHPQVYKRTVWLMERFLKTHMTDKRLSQN